MGAWRKDIREHWITAILSLALSFHSDNIAVSIASYSAPGCNIACEKHLTSGDRPSLSHFSPVICSRFPYSLSTRLTPFLSPRSSMRIEKCYFCGGACLSTLVCFSVVACDNRTHFLRPLCFRASHCESLNPCFGCLFSSLSNLNL